MTVGHTKFSCDRNFGVLKKKTNVTILSTLYTIDQAVNESGMIINCNFNDILKTTKIDTRGPTKL